MNCGVGVDWCGWACGRPWPRELSGFLYMSISKNGSWPSSSISIVNCIFLWMPFRWLRNSPSLCFPWGQMTKVSSTCLNQHIGLCDTCSIALFSKSSMKKFTITGESGESIATPSVCSQNFPSKQKYVEVRTCLNNAKMPSSKWWLSSFSESAIETLVNRDTIISSGCVCIDLSVWMNCNK